MADVRLDVRPPDPPSRGQLYLQLRVLVRELASRGERRDWILGEIYAALNTVQRGQLPAERKD